MTNALPVIEFGGMSYIRWNGFYICCDLECPANKGKPHVWVAKKLPNACGKCKRITWNRKDNRFKPGRPKLSRAAKRRK